MSIITKMMRFDCVYWEYDGTDMYGKPSYKDPVQIRCRWQASDGENLTSDGNETLNTKTKVYTLIDIKINSVLMLGTLEDITDETSPTNNDNAYEVFQFEKIPDLKNRKVLRRCLVG